MPWGITANYRGSDTFRATRYATDGPSLRQGTAPLIAAAADANPLPVDLDLLVAQGYLSLLDPGLAPHAT